MGEVGTYVYYIYIFNENRKSSLILFPEKFI